MIKLVVKFFLLILFFMVMIMFIGRDLLVWLVMFIVSIVAGIFRFSFEFICEQDEMFCILAVLFLPISMLIGIGIAFK